jgi:hypothetical protein
MDLRQGSPVEKSPEQTVALAPPPPAVHELAEGCRAFVKAALGVELDYEPETLSVLDHYVEQAREAAVAQPDTLHLLAHAVGAYFGEVVRRRYASWWQMDGSDPAYWQIQLEPVYLAFSPVALVYDGLLRGADAARAVEEEGAEMSQLELDDEDRVAVAARLAELPPVTDAEFYAPSTRLEVIDIAVEAIRAKRIAEGGLEAHLTEDDYEGLPLPN